MKKGLKFLVLAAAVISLAACSGKNYYGEIPKVMTKGSIDTASYALGVSMALSFQQSDIQPLEVNSFIEGFKTALLKGKTKISQADLPMIVQNYIFRSQALRGQSKIEESEAFFAENGQKDSVETSESGLQYKILNEGDVENKPTIRDTVVVNYSGTLLDGTEFDSTYGRGEPVKFPVDGFIPGWIEGIQLIGKGGKITLWIPYELGYGEKTSGPIPPYSTLKFEIELLDVVKCKAEKK